MGVKDTAQTKAEPNNELSDESVPAPKGKNSSADQVASQEQDESTASLDVIFEILKNSRRREVLRFLRERDEQVSLGDLAEHVAAIENDTTTDALTSSERKRVYVGLYQCHLPKMDDIGVVEFNQDRGHITLTEKADDFEKYLDRSEEKRDRQWYQYYGAVSVIGAMVLAASVALSLSGSIVLGLFSLVVGVAGACSVYHWSVEREDLDSE
jgi:DNA-binding transcriptional ArsR family regulator